MPKLLFSKIGIYEFKDLMQNVKPRRRIDIVLSRRRQKKDIQCIIHRKNDDSNDHKLKQPTLKKLLKDKKCLAAFRTFLQSEFSEENIDFWLACEDFRKNTSPDDVGWKAVEIYQRFLHPTACREINVDHHIREKIKNSLEEPSLSHFDEAQRHVYQLMERDSCPRFLRSDTYLSLRSKTRTLWYI
uniref:Regulator of G protein signaling 1 n=1 Tax=Myripristis murdjan TaxID=586833 RepID=A0A667ZU54_9TELE